MKIVDGLRGMLVYGTCALSLCAVLQRPVAAAEIPEAQTYLDIAKEAGKAPLAVAKAFLGEYKIRQTNVYPGGYNYTGDVKGKPFKFWTWAPLGETGGIPEIDSDIAMMDVGKTESYVRTPSSDVMVQYDKDYRTAKIFVMSRANGAVRAYSAQVTPGDSLKTPINIRETKETLPARKVGEIKGMFDKWYKAGIGMMMGVYRHAASVPLVRGDSRLETAMAKLFGWLLNVGVTDFAARVSGATPPARGAWIIPPEGKKLGSNLRGGPAG